MRHMKDGRKLSRTQAHRRALLRNLTTALFEHERIETTLEKAKEARRVAERMITYAKRGDLHSRRLVAQTVMSQTVVRKLFDTIAPWYADRPGGYTRIMRTRARLGDGGEMAILELVKTVEQRAADLRAREKSAKEKEERKSRREEKAAEAAEMKGEKTEKAEKAEKTEKGEKPDKREKPRAEKRSEKAKALKPEKTKAEKPEKSKAEKPKREKKSDKPKKP